MEAGGFVLVQIVSIDKCFSAYNQHVLPGQRMQRLRIWARSFVVPACSLAGIHLQRAVGGFKRLLVGAEFLKPQLLELIEREVSQLKCVLDCHQIHARQWLRTRL